MESLNAKIVLQASKWSLELVVTYEVWMTMQILDFVNEEIWVIDDGVGPSTS